MLTIRAACSCCSRCCCCCCRHVQDDLGWVEGAGASPNGQLYVFHIYKVLEFLRMMHMMAVVR